MLPSLGGGCSYCRRATHCTGGKAVECVSEMQRGEDFSIKSHSWLWVCSLNCDMCARALCLSPCVWWAYSSSCENGAQTKPPLRAWAGDHDLGKCHSAHGGGSPVTQSHGSGVHQCAVALWQKPSGVVLRSAVPNPEV